MNNQSNNDFSNFEASGSSFGEGDARSNLIINYLPQLLTDNELFEIFSVLGPLKTCRIIKDFKTGYSYGFGFVDYEHPEDAAKAISELNNLSLQHKRIKVSYARPPGDDIKETNLYIQNIPRSYGLEELESIFAPFGMIVQKNLLKDKITGAPKGVGFIRYNKRSEADAAIANMNGHLPEGGTQPLAVRIAEEHGKRKAEYSPGYYPPGPQIPQGKIRPFNNRGGPVPPMGGMHPQAPQYPPRGNYSNMGGKVPVGRTMRRYNPMGGGGGPGIGQFRFPHSNFSSDSYQPF